MNEVEINPEIMETISIWGSEITNTMHWAELYGNMPIDGEIMWLLAWLWIIVNILILVGFLLKAWWLWNINKKLWEPHPWLAWIPVIQMYSFVKAAWKNWIWILWLIIGFIAFIIPWVIIVAILCNWIAKRTGRWFWSAVWVFFIPAIMLPIIWYKLKDKTVITIAHRLSTIEHADKILVMQKGKVIAIGSHKELLESSDVYQKLAGTFEN